MTRRMVLPVAGLLAAALAGFAQERKEVDVLVGTTAGMPAQAQAIHILGAATLDGKVVKNMPYSAEASTEMTRVLADGTRIVNRYTTTIARDKEGRTRREDNLANLAPFANRNDQAPRTATIVDPVTSETVILDLNQKTAHKIAAGRPMFFRSEKTSPGGGREIREERVQVMVREGSVSSSAGPAGERHLVQGAVGHGAMGPDTLHVPALPMAGSGAMFMRYDSRNSRSESLGKQVMEGVEVEGTRVTTTIPAGEIGNDRPIVSVSERWYSNELQMVIYSKTADPQFGETVYRVSNLRRTEPSADLFRVPADFKVQEPQGGLGPRPMMIQRELKQ